MLDTGQSAVDLLAAVASIQRRFIAAVEPHQAFDEALQLLLQMSGSEFGVIGEVLTTTEGRPFLKAYAISNGSWNDATQAFYDSHGPQGQEFQSLRNRLDEVIATAKPVISNDSRSIGVPADHPLLHSFLGLPFFGSGAELVGTVGLANRQGGYDDELVAMLEPLCDALGVMIVATQRERRRRETEEALRASEARYRIFTDHITDGLFLHGTDGRIVDVNRRACESLGYTRDELIGMMPLDFDPDVTRDLLENNLTRLAHGETFAFDTRHRRKDGTTFPVEVRIRPLWSDGQPLHLALVCDITERKLAEEKLLESERRFTEFMEHLPGFAWIKDLQGRYVYANSVSSITAGITREQHLGNTDIEIHPPEIAAQFQETDRQVIDTGREIQAVTTLRGKNGQLHHRLVSKFPIPAADNRPALIGGIAIDVTERMQAEEALLETQRRLNLILRGADVGLWDWDLVTDCVAYSREWKSQLGYEEDEIAGTLDGWKSRVHPDDMSAVIEKVNTAIKSCATEYSAEFRMRHKDGSWRWILALGFVAPDSQGQPARMLGIHIDITQRKQAEEALRISEQRYRLIAELASTYSYELKISEDYQFAFQWIGGKFFEVTGYHPDELAGLNWARLIPEHDLPLLKNIIDGLRADPPQIADDLELQIVTRSGEKRWIRHLANPQQPVIPGQPVTVFGAAIDITERKAAENALRESEARMRTVLENLDRVAVQAYELDGTITFWNKASELFYGYSAEEALGRDTVDLLYAEENRERERQTMTKALHLDEQLPAEEVEVVRRDGLKMTVFASRIVHPRPGKEPEFFCFDVDITDRKRAEEELAIRQAELLHSSRLTTVGRMVADLSHEVSQPLSAIGNFAAASAEILDAGGDDQKEALQAYIREIAKQNDRCGAILQRMRDFTRRTSAPRTNCDAAQLLHESVALVANDFRRHDVRINCEVAPELPPVHCDRVQLEQVIVNLLSNARDAVASLPSDRRLILIRATTEEKSVVFKVEDRGPGISGDTAKRLFEPFFTTKEHGMGLGLSICRSIVKEHGGQLDFLTNSAGGATFRVKLPISGEDRYG